MGKVKVFKVVTWIVVVATLICAIYIMYYDIGIDKNLGFGAGAYYYADIPNFQKYLGHQVSTSIPYIVYLILFLIWGYIMYRFWKFIDRK